MGGRRSRNKGANEERAVVNQHRSLGFDASRTLEKGKRSDGSDTWDIDLCLHGENTITLHGECKVRGSGFKLIYDSLTGNDFLTIRSDRSARLYVIPEEIWFLLISNFNKGADNEQCKEG